MINQAIINRGMAAKRVQESPDVQSIFAEIRSDLFKQFTKTNVSDVQTREDLHKVTYAMDLFEKKLESYAGQMRIEMEKTDTR